MRKQVPKGGDEYDCISRWRRWGYLGKRAGKWTPIKRRMNKRFRKEWQKECKAEIHGGTDRLTGLDADSVSPVCKRCEIPMKPGVAMMSTSYNTQDFPGSEIYTVVPGGPGEVVDCWKCPACGHSITRGGRREH